MKVKTSITLSEDLLDDMDKWASDFASRSELVEAALRAFIKQRIRERVNARDLDILNRHAEQLNREAEDALAYQVIP